MGYPAPPLKPTTPEEATVIVWLVIVVAVAVGIGAFYYSTQASTPEDAAWLRKCGFISFGIAAVIFVGKRLMALFFD
jgi:nicotinamide riboside transporter PnuC